MTQEVFRRIHNTKAEAEESLRNEILDMFMIDLKHSGFNEKERLRILEGGFKTIENLQAKVAKGERPFYRPADFNKEERRKEKEKKKNEWFISNLIQIINL